MVQENKTDYQWTAALWPKRTSLLLAWKQSQKTLPHNSNLLLWKKIQSGHCPICSTDSVQHRQTQLYILNNCHTALKQGHYNVRHDKVLSILFQHLQKNISSSLSVTADLGDREYCTLQYMLTDLRPDIIVWNEQQIHLFILTMCRGKISRMLQSGKKWSIY